MCDGPRRLLERAILGSGCSYSHTIMCSVLGLTRGEISIDTCSCFMFGKATHDRHKISQLGADRTREAFNRIIPWLGAHVS